jgi:Tfp pilus assembly protein PilP
MKKLLTIISAACVAMIVSCGPSAEEKARMEQATQDSLNQVMEQARQDSLNAVMELARQDSMAMAAAMQDSLNKVMQDSLAAMETKLKNVTKPKPKPKADPKPTKPEDVKPGQGRG